MYSQSLISKSVGYAFQHFEYTGNLQLFINFRNTANLVGKLFIRTQCLIQTFNRSEAIKSDIDIV